MPGMPYPTADLHLRGSGPIRVIWTGETPAPLVVHLGDEPRIDTPAVVLAVTNFDDALSALQWCADHGAELGGDPRRLIVAGEHAPRWPVTGAGPRSNAPSQPREER